MSTLILRFMRNATASLVSLLGLAVLVDVFVPETLFWSLLGLVIGTFIALFALPLVPNAIANLSNNPNANRPEGEQATKLEHPKSEYGFFTFLEPGRVKWIERGGKAIRALMAHPGHMFAGERAGSGLSQKNPLYWEIEKTGSTGRESHPIPFPTTHIMWFFYGPVSILWWLWKRWVYKITGGVFTGFYPFQRIRVYPMEKFVMHVSDGSDGKERGTVLLVHKRDWSDHYRVADFQFPVLVPDANTSDKLAVMVLVNVIARTHNPFLTAYYTDDDWATRFMASVTHAVTDHVRCRPLDQVLSIKNEPTERTALSDEIAAIGAKDGNAYDMGIVIPPETPPQVLDISAANKEHRNKLADVAIAEVDKKAAKIRAEGLAASTIEQGKALQSFPEALVIPLVEGRVRTAEAAAKNPNAIVIIGGDTGNSMEAAILQQLRRNAPTASNPSNTSNP